MKIQFNNCKLYETKLCKGLWLNNITFRTKEGSLITVDRKRTEYECQGNTLNMVWHDVYILGRYDIKPALAEQFKEATFFHADIDDDAEEEYQIDFSYAEINFEE